MEEVISNLDYIEYVINEDYNGLRIDKALASLNPILSRNQIQTLIDEGYITCNEKGVKASLKVFEGDVIHLYEKNVEDDSVEPENIPLDIVYEDDDLIIINKPKGMVVHPSIGHNKGTLVNALMYHFKDLSNVNGKLRPGIVHRLDMDTSGLLVVAKNEKIKNTLQHKWQDIVSKREYIAICEGIFQTKQGTVKSYLKENVNHLMYSSNDKSGQFAVTHYKVLKQNKEYSMVEVNIDSGRKNQIRVHMGDLKHKVVGDEKYGPVSSPIGRLGLHAYVLEFKHPTTGKVMNFKAKIPDVFNGLFSKR